MIPWVPWQLQKIFTTLSLNSVEGGGGGVVKNDETTRCTYNVTPTLFLYFIHLFIVAFILFVNIYMLNTIKDRADDDTWCPY